MAMGRVEDTESGITRNRDLLVYQKVSVGEFREFVNQTSYLTDCEKQGGAWIFAVGKQWIRKVDASWDNPYGPQEENDPVVLVSWYDAVMFANWKSVRDGLAKAYRVGRADGQRVVEWIPLADGYRLPTAEECQWAAARAQTHDDFSARTRKRKPAIATTLNRPPDLDCDGVVDGRGLEWCWDPSTAGGVEGSTRPVSTPASPSTFRRVVVDDDKENLVSERCRACHPQTAVGTLGFRLVRSQR